MDAEMKAFSNITLLTIDNFTRDTSFDNVSTIIDLGPKRDSLTTVIPMTVVYAMILVTGATGNACTCLVIARNRYMHTATNYYLFSLAISDLLLLVLGLPQEIYELWNRYPYAFGESVCIIRGLTSETCTNASILTITAFTVERYVAICHPLRSRAMSHLPRAIKTILAIWVMAALCAVPLALQFGIVYERTVDGELLWESASCTIKRPLPHAFEISTFLFFVLPISVISVLYVFIGLRLRMKAPGRRECSPETANGPAGGGRQSLAARRAVVKMLVAVVVSFFICWSPFHAQRLFTIYATNPTPLAYTTFTILTYISGVTYYLSSTINPILYQVLSLKFRQAFKDTFGSCCFPKDTTIPDVTYTSTYGNHVDGSIKSTTRHRLSSSFQQLPSFSSRPPSSPNLKIDKSLSASCANVCIKENVPEKISLLGNHLTVSNV